MRWRFFPFSVAFLWLVSCGNNQERQKALLEQKRLDSLWAAKPIEIAFQRPTIRENAKNIVENWPELNKFDGFIRRFFAQKRGDVSQGVKELTQVVDSLYTSKIPAEANIPQIKSRINLLRNYIYRFEDLLIDEPVNDSLFNENVKEIKKVYNSLYVQLNRINLFKPNPELLDTIE